jgi:hypothetical protein
MIACEAIMTVQRVSLTAVGRAAANGSTPRQGIKRVDRLLSNPALQVERLLWWSHIARSIASSRKRIIVLIDWTKLHGDLWSLTASVPFDGRSVPVLSVAMDKKQVGARTAHQRFLQELKSIFPQTCNIVIVADAEFRSTFFTACRESGMHFVIRLRNPRARLLLRDGRRATTFRRTFYSATEVARCLGTRVPYATSSSASRYRVVLAPKPRTASRRDRNPGYQKKRAKEPWLLASTLENEPADSIVSIYAMRMQIEETFRDAKSRRFGWALEFARTTCPRRFSILLLLLALAMLATMLLGAVVQARGMQHGFHASSRARKALSIFSLGSLTLALQIRLRPSARELRQQIAAIALASSIASPEIHWPRSRGRLVRGPLPHDLFCSDCGWRGLALGWPP